MQHNLKNVFTDADLEQIRKGFTGRAEYVFSNLAGQAAQCGNSLVVVATWAKPRFSNDRSLTINSAATLWWVVRGILKNGCINLQFWAGRPQSAPLLSEIAYQDIFQQ